MKRISMVLVMVALLSLFLGWETGNFFTGRSFQRLISTIPASPIVTEVKYEKQKHTLIYSLFNPGGVPISVIEENFVFKPGKNTTQQSYVVSNIPLHVIIPPSGKASVNLKLKAGTPKLALGDVVLATFTYTHPLSKDLYTVGHIFTMNKTGQEKTQIKNQKKKE